VFFSFIWWLTWQVHVVERGAALAEGRVAELLEQPVGVRGAARDQERRFVLDDGAFQAEAAGDEAEAAGAFEFLFVAVAGGHFHHRREPAAVPRGDAALVEFHVLEHVGVKAEKKPNRWVGLYTTASL
jgi:hypothetical protein